MESKTYVIIFNKVGHWITRYNFTINHSNLVIVQNHTYLGISTLANIGRKSNTNFKNICDSLVFEKLNIKLCKYILCTGIYSVNDAVWGELERFPFMLILSHSFKYLYRL